MVAKDRLTESDNVVWRNFEPQTQNRKREKKNRVQTLTQSDQGNKQICVRSEWSMVSKLWKELFSQRSQ